MMRNISASLLVCMCSMLLISGCLKKRITWSPDGHQAAVIGDQGLYLSDSEGSISSLLVEDVTRAEWFPDGKQLALLRGYNARSWSQVEALLPTPQLQTLIEIGDRLSNKITTFEQWEERVDQFTSSGKVSSSEVDGIKLYLRDKKDDKLPPAVSAKWGKLNDFEIVYLQVGTLGEGKVELGPVLFGGGASIFDVRVAPNGNALAFTYGSVGGDQTEDNETVELWLVSATDGETAQKLATHVALYPDWRADGRTLVYVQSVRSFGADDVGEGDDSLIDTLVTHEVLDADGQIKPSDSPKGLVLLARQSSTRVRCLKDGRILFNSLEIHLPTTERDVTERNTIFAVHPERQATVTRLIPRADEPLIGDWISHYEVSPDEKLVSIAGDKGTVSILNLQSGHIREIQPNRGPEDPRTVPVWRYPDQLCFVQPIMDEDKKPTGKAELVLYQDGQTRVISNHWPDEVKEGFLD
jgi:WD40 repeat protein